MSGLRLGAATPERLVILLHGVGGDAASLAPFAEQVAGALPDAAIVVPDGAEPFDGGQHGRQWFSIRGVTDENRPARVAAALPAVEALIEAALAKDRLDRDRLILGGFSQGAIMTLAVAAGRRPPAAALALAGRLAAPIAAAPRRPALFIGHGARDPVIPVAEAERAAAAFTAAGFPVSRLIEPGLGHAISPTLARLAIRWIGDGEAAMAA